MPVQRRAAPPGARLVPSSAHTSHTIPVIPQIVTTNESLRNATVLWRVHVEETPVALLKAVLDGRGAPGRGRQSVKYTDTDGRLFYTAVSVA
jgi:hypothetical protein